MASTTGNGGGGGGQIRKIQRLDQRVADLETAPPGTTYIDSADSWPAAVAGIITLAPFHVYRLRASSTMPAGVTFKGHNVTILGDTTVGTIIITNAAAATFKSDGDGYWNLRGLYCLSSGGPMFDITAGVTATSAFLLDTCVLLGATSQVAGIVRSSDRISVIGSFLIDFEDGLQLDGAHSEVSFDGTHFQTHVGTTVYTGLTVLSGATVQSLMISDCRFTTVEAADRCLFFDPSATYSTSVQINTCALRGPGSLFEAGSLEQGDPRVITINSHSAAPNSLWTATAGFNGNLVETSIGVQGTQYPFGNDEPTHDLFNGGSLVERFTLSGAETQDQVFTYNGLVPRAFNLSVDCELDKGGGGSIICELCIRVDGSPVADSATETEVTNSATFARAETTVTLNPGQTFSPCIANATSTANPTIKSAKLSAARVV
jgi:hypothetical protein